MPELRAGDRTRRLGAEHGVLVTRFVPLREVDERFVARWKELAATAIEPNPFFEPQIVLPAARLLAGGDEVALLVVESRTGLLFVLPVRSASRFRRVPVPALVSWHHDHSFLGTPLVAAGAVETAWSAALAHLLRERPAPWSVLGLVPAEGPLADGLSAALTERRLRPTRFEAHHRAVVHRRTHRTYLEQTVSARHLKTLRRLRRRLGEQLDTDLVTVDQAATGDVARAQEVFLDLESSGWKGRHGGALACQPAQAQFFRELGEGFAADQRLQLWTLGSAERTVAASCNLLAGEAVFHFKISYDETFARYSPGVQLELDMIDAFHDDARLRILDSCTSPGDSVSDKLYPDRRALQTLLLPLHGAGFAAARSTPLLSKAYRQMRRLHARTRRGGSCGS
jgi:CelD/BcsL family acetyltransferase involved in cellulose biosynthesis